MATNSLLFRDPDVSAALIHLEHCRDLIEAAMFRHCGGASTVHFTRALVLIEDAHESLLRMFAAQR